VLAGLAHAASIASPLSLGRFQRGEPLWMLQPVALAVLVYWVLRAASSWQAARLGWLFATAWLAGSLWWLFISMHSYGGLAAPLAALAVLALAVFLGSYYAAACALFWRLQRWARRPVKEQRGRFQRELLQPLQMALPFAALWLLAELARGTWLTGLPWGAGGYAHVLGPLALLTRWIGVYGIGAVASVLAALLAVSAVLAKDNPQPMRGRWLFLMGIGASFLGSYVANMQRDQVLPALHNTAPFSIALLQGNIAQDEKFQHGSGVPLALDWYGEQLRMAQADLVIAPETAIPLLPQQLEAGYLDDITQRYRTGQPALLVGIPLGDAEHGYTNSVLGFTATQQPPYRYDKHHLVPFGEFIPPFFRWFTDALNIPLGDFARGSVGQPPLHWRGQRIAPHICYEDLFGEELAAQFSDAANAPTLLVNVSNIGWFGDSLAVDQHLNISRMRALEFERPMVRATNTGATAVIDPLGRVTQRLPPFTRAVLHAEVQGRSGPVTPYAQWVARYGLLPLWLLGLGYIGVVIVVAMRRADTG